MKYIITESQFRLLFEQESDLVGLVKKIIKEQQETSFQQYMDQLLENPVDFLNKLKSDEQFKTTFIQSYKSNSTNNFELMSETKRKHILKYKPIGGRIKDKIKNVVVKEFQVSSLEEFNKIKEYMQSEKSKGINLILISDSVPFYGTPNGDEMAEVFNIALGQQYFK